MKKVLRIESIIVLVVFLFVSLSFFPSLHADVTDNSEGSAPIAQSGLKLTFLVDNNTKVGYYFRGESAFSLLVEDGSRKILFDAGYSDAFLRNAQQMGISLLDLDYIVLSHGHLDHTWGLIPLTKYFTEAGFGKIAYKKPTVIAHPNVFEAKELADEVQIGSIFSKEQLSCFCDINLSKSPVWITDKLVFLGEIERTNDYENKTPVGKDNSGSDYVEDDSAIVYKSPDGLVVISGCAHAGICNTIEYAKKVCKDDRIVDVIGGFHLLNPPESQLAPTLDYISKINTGALHACHCVDLKSKIALSKVANLQEVWVGQTLEFK